jgi:hypothetical protein
MQDRSGSVYLVWIYRLQRTSWRCCFSVEFDRYERHICLKMSQNAICFIVLEHVINMEVKYCAAVWLNLKYSGKSVCWITCIWITLGPWFLTSHVWNSRRLVWTTLFTHRRFISRQGMSSWQNMCLVHTPPVSLTQLQLDSANGGLFTHSRVMPLKRMNCRATRQPGFCEQLINSGYNPPSLPHLQLTLRGYRWGILPRCEHKGATTAPSC